MRKILTLCLLVILVAGCAPTATTIQKAPNEIASGDDLHAVIVYYHKMPCLIVNSMASPGNYVTSITCDWEKWDGKID